MSLNRVIGREGRIPWHLPEDFKWFKRATLGGFVIMGRKTFESLGRPLPNRTNIVLTRAPRRLAHDPAHAKIFGGATVGGWVPRLGRAGYQLGFERIEQRDVWLVRSVRRLLAALARERPNREVFVIGGAQVYAQLLPHCTDLYLTVVQRQIEGDTFFPEFEPAFSLHDVLLRHPEFEVRHYRNLQCSSSVPLEGQVA
jgi:dihydrofolate reductase